MIPNPGKIAYIYVMQHVKVDFRLEAPGRSIEASVNLPREALRPVELLPVLLPMAGAVAGMSESRVVDQGETIACRAGCGACCRQLVPISEIEALHLASLVEAMPEDRRSRVKERFRDARSRASVVLSGVSGEEIGKASWDYFKLGIACPFLENESCSIHARRPAICREYLVVSDPRHCAELDSEHVRRVPVPMPVSSALMRFSDGRGEGARRPLPLIDALEFAAGCSEQLQPRIPAPELFQNFMRCLTSDHEQS
jgi:Fe-S-cluster containining protein